MPNRRAVLKLAAGAAAFAAPLGTGAAAAATPVRAAEFYLVNGWVLTRADLEMLGLKAGRPLA